MNERPLAPQSATQFANVRWRGHEHLIEYVWIAPQRRQQPLLVFLHEGLGSVAMWKDFPRTLCEAAGCRGLVLSRWGYGQSSPRASHERWPVDFMHQQARDFLPRFFETLDLDTAATPPWFYGHSDGGSIALIYAASRPEHVAGLVVAAPHTFVEDLTISSIEKAKDGYVTTDLRSKLARYHADPDSAFWGWNDVWLDPAFRQFDIRPLLKSIGCPVLAVQGREDEYGTLAQIEAIAQSVPQAELFELIDCGHSPHRDQPDALIRKVCDFMHRHRARPVAGRLTP
ncbi:MAG: alpha/beta hydrolase [Caldimonas sp.]|uniref:alpha/beta fold hydrolase n=1 Tax=Caldimonas taiwanensis TaxID=307483 RepID=UPI00078421F7|nr:alpha/beta hydrolase [Caldimonas taiwanensis]GIX25660.1 MAG: alpha/beta hydrolase [Caldimonas sp.]